ncbi:hypothetical protein ACLOJK_000064 [Asimina triloba]
MEMRCVRVGPEFVLAVIGNAGRVGMWHGCMGTASERESINYRFPPSHISSLLVPVLPSPAISLSLYLCHFQRQAIHSFRLLIFTAKDRGIEVPDLRSLLQTHGFDSLDRFHEILTQHSRRVLLVCFLIVRRTSAVMVDPGIRISRKLKLQEMDIVVCTVMTLPMVDCRSLIEFCKDFEQHRNSLGMTERRKNNSHLRSKRRSKSLNPLSHPFCDHSPFAAIDIVILLLVLVAIGVLTIPYLKFIFREASELLPEAFVLMGDVLCTTPVAYTIGLVMFFVLMVVVWEIIHQKSRKCGNPYCKGLHKAVEFDIQLESEECVKYMPPLPREAYGVRPLELGEEHKELEAELKRMAPLNGRTVLIFRAPCGCPAGRMEVWGPKKVRRIKK